MQLLWLFVIICEKNVTKFLKDWLKKGNTSTGWFFGFKLHFILNTFGEIVSMTITGGNVNDRSPVMDMVKGITGKLVGDKGYISKKLSNLGSINSILKC